MAGVSRSLGRLLRPRPLTRPLRAPLSTAAPRATPVRKIAELDPRSAGSIRVQGWVRSVRAQRTVAFLTLDDGSCPGGVQVVVEDPSAVRGLRTGACVDVVGSLVVREEPAALQHSGPSAALRAREIHSSKVHLVGPCDEQYPLQKKYHTPEFLRDVLHLRCRTSALGSAMRIRSAASLALHEYLASRGFIHVHTPVLTPLDCEGAGEMFRVHAPVQHGEAFFGRPMHLAVSGQLYAEMAAMALNKVYAFGPTFRAENSHTPHHLAEFWMLEPEMAFAGLEDVLEVAEGCVRAAISHVMERCSMDVEHLSRSSESGEEASGPEVTQSLIRRLESIASLPRFYRMTYSEAVRALENSAAAAATATKFQYPVQWGLPLQREHEQFLAEQVCNGPVFVTHYPRDIKPFYMKQTTCDMGDTVACMDLLLPRVGEIAGGSEREDDVKALEKAMRRLRLDPEQYRWYLDLRRFGSAPHAGFGLGFDRLVQLLTGFSNIRDVVLVPRVPGSLAF